MNLIQEDIKAILPSLTWEDFTEDGDVYVCKYAPTVDKESNLYNRFLRLRDKYPSDYAAALVSKLPEDAKLVDYDHMSLILRVRRDA